MTETAGLVLVVEDNDVNRLLTAKILRHLGLDSYLATNGEEALAWCQQHTPSLILMDISLPGKDGLEVTRELRRLPRFADLPILALTAHAFDGWEQRTRDAGCTEYIAKPVTLADLAAAVARHLPPPA